MSSRQSVAPPNIVLIHWHDLGTRLGCYGHPDVASPRIDQLADDGLRFDAAFSTAPLCSPARGSLFTGLYPARHGLTGLAHRGSHYVPGVQTVPMMLSDCGYRTALVGLQHESTDEATVGFDEVRHPDGRPFCDPVADLAVDWLSQLHGNGPFFLTVGFFEVHRPYREEWYGSPDGSERQRVEVPTYLPDNIHTREDLARLHRSINIADAAAGRIIDAVQHRPDADNTMIIFTTDHGIAFPRAKSTLYDPGIHVALIMVPPPAWRIEPRAVANLVSHIDLAPTLVELAGGHCATDGLSFAGAVLERAPWPRTEIYAAKDLHEVYDPMRAVRTARHKYIRNLHPGPELILPTDIEESPTRLGLDERYRRPRVHEEFYDLWTDPAEAHNLVDHEEDQPGLAQLRSLLDIWLDNTSDPAQDAWSATMASLTPGQSTGVPRSAATPAAGPPAH